MLSRQTGVTLIELIISMVVISISVVGIFSVMNLTVKHSADPLTENQAVAIAESYMEEILLQNYSCSGTTQTVRANFNCVDDYNNLVNTGVQNQLGAAISGLSQYTVSVTVSAATTLTGSVSAKQITVSVTGPGMSNLSLVGYRAQY
jgi:MSHA pilin protein MshD